MARVDELANLYEKHISLPWQKTTAGAQRVIMLVYDKEIEKAIRARINEFEMRTKKYNYKWQSVDYTDGFAKWMAGEEYRDAYFEYPEDLTTKIEGEFVEHITGDLIRRLDENDEDTVVALIGAANLYGFIRISRLISTVERHIKGRLLVFFPGTKEGNNYQLLDARDGFNYLAQGITLNGSGGAI